jgi:hypothetical protein
MVHRVAPEQQVAMAIPGSRKGGAIAQQWSSPMMISDEVKQFCFTRT